jgi:hypothetical protein
MAPILQLRRKTLLIIAPIVIGSLGIWIIWSDTTDCDYRPSATDGNRAPTHSPVSSLLSQSNNASPSGPHIDEDRDGLDDSEEDQLASRFAPIIYHGQCESNYPTSVDWLLARAGLYEYDSEAKPTVKKVAAAKLGGQADLLNRWFSTNRSEPSNIGSDSTYSFCKRSAYFLANVQRSDQTGARETPADWITYVHSYPNKSGGVTIQYWRCYSYNSGSFLYIDFSHGGDWEAIAVHLDAALKPEFVAFLGHTGIEYHTSNVQWDGDHPKVWSEEGGHASLPDGKGMRSKRFTRQETWSGGQVIWWDGTPAGASGGLLNVGEKSGPRNGQVFVQYSGLWGSPGRLFITSGYWGPAFNETDATCEGGQKAYKRSAICSVDAARCGRIFHKAWCDGMDARRLDLEKECYALRSTP